MLQSADEEKIIHLGKSNLMFVCWRKKKNGTIYTMNVAVTLILITQKRESTMAKCKLHPEQKHPYYGTYTTLAVYKHLLLRWTELTQVQTQSFERDGSQLYLQLQRSSEPSLSSGRKTWSTSSSRWIIRTGA